MSLATEDQQAFSLRNMSDIQKLKISYCQANRCWQANNLKACAQICKALTRNLDNLVASRDPDRSDDQLIQLKDLVWFLKIKCLADEYHTDECFLLNEDDISSDDQVQTISATRDTSKRTERYRPTTAQPQTSRHRSSRTGTNRGQRIGVLTGNMPASRAASRQSGLATTSYRPLTTSLTASQTAFSRSTRPLLKYSTSNFLAKPIFEYLYNAQNVTSVCPDYRQCLEYLNLVRNMRRHSGQKHSQAVSTPRATEEQLISLTNDHQSMEQASLGAYWSTAFGICYFHLKMHKQAEEFFQTSVGVDARWLDPHLWLVKVYLRRNQPARVLQTCDEALGQGHNAIVYNWKARVQSLLGDSLAAHLSLRESLRFCPTNIEALANVGHYSFYGDKLELALKCFERINQLSMNTGASGSQENSEGGSLLSAISVGHSSAAELFNNMALCHFECGNYEKVMPLFQRAFLNSSSREITSNIWYNISFVPLSFGAHQLAIACLRLALKADSQNGDAINNLGVLRYQTLAGDPLHYRNRQEYWSLNISKMATNEPELSNIKDQRRRQAQFDEAETFFVSARGTSLDKLESAEMLPEMLHNMAILKRCRGQLLASVKYCDLYLQYDANNHTILEILNEINELISHDC